MIKLTKQKLLTGPGLALLIALATLVIISLLFLLRSKPEPKVLAEKTWRVAVVKARQGDYAPEILLHGQIVSPRVTELDSSVDAYVLTTPMLEGTVAKQGQIVIKLDDRDARIEISQRSAAVDQLHALIAAELNRNEADQKALVFEQKLLALRQKAVERQAYLIEKEVGSEALRDQAKETEHQQELVITARELAINDHKNRLTELKARLATNEALLARAKLDLARTEVRAPFQGRVAKLDVSPGDWVQRNESLMTIYDINSLEMRAQIPTQYLPLINTAIAKQQTITARARVNHHVITLQLDRLAGEITPGQGGIDALFKILQDQASLPLGQSFPLIMRLPVAKATFTLPIQALYGNDKIYIVKQQRMHAIKVQRIGVIYSGDIARTVIVQSHELKNNALVITTQLPNARSGLLIDPKKSEQK